jgi:hypothetical protein
MGADRRNPDAHARVERLDRERTDLTGERARVRDRPALLRVEESERELGETATDRSPTSSATNARAVNERERRSDAFAREQQDTDAVREVAGAPRCRETVPRPNSAE